MDAKKTHSCYIDSGLADAGGWKLSRVDERDLELFTSAVLTALGYMQVYSMKNSICFFRPAHTTSTRCVSSTIEDVLPRAREDRRSLPRSAGSLERRMRKGIEWQHFSWPELAMFEWSAADREARRRFLGGSDANIILSGDAARIRQLWLEKRGEAEPEDLSGKLPVMLGCWTEPFNRQWYEKLTGDR